MDRFFLTHKIGTVTASALLVLSAISSPARAVTLAGEPVFSEVERFSTRIENNPTDIYFPVSTEATDPIPLALLFQGALVDKADYQNYAQVVASYGFAVVVPNNERTLVGPTGPATGLFPEQGQIQDVLDFMTGQNQRPTSPLNGRLDTESLGLLGHSFGGAAGIASVQGLCLFPLCADEAYEVPDALEAGIFYGTNFDLGPDIGTPPIDNQVPTGYIFGTRDGVTEPALTVEAFEKTLNPPKVLVEVEGANHYGITNEDSFRDPMRPTLEQAIATDTIGRWSGLFLRAHVLNDPEAFSYVYGGGDTLEPVVTVSAVKTPEPSVISSVVAGIAMLTGLRLRKETSGNHQSEDKVR
ncbi:MAG: chlorophyllase [Cyanobacteria bacterium J06629_19]